MIKVNINYSKIEALNSKKTINNFLDGRSANVLSEGENDGVYYIKNYKKDQLRKITDEDTMEDLLNDGFKVDESNFYLNNVLLKRPQSDDIYIVKPLDTLDKISKMLNLEKEAIINLNNLKSERLFVGQQLKILS